MRDEDVEKVIFSIVFLIAALAIYGAVRLIG